LSQTNTIAAISNAKKLKMGHTLSFEETVTHQ
jgi:hypothetical protein